MRCPKCRGNVFEEVEDSYCLQCGWRPSNPVCLPVKKHRSRCRPAVWFKEALLEEYLGDTLGETEKVRRLLRRHPRLRHMLSDLWHKDDLAQSFTLRHLSLLYCYSVLGENAGELLEHLNALSYLDRYSLLRFINKLPKPRGGRRWSATTINLALKLLLGASYQWLLDRETEREKISHPTWDSRKVRSRADASLRSAYRLFLLALRLLRLVGLDIEMRHYAVTRALWESEYRPIVLSQKGLVVDVCY